MELHVALPMIGGIIIIVGSILLLYKGKVVLDVAEITFPTNDTSGMPKDRSAYRSLESSHLDQRMPAGYEPFSN